MATGKAYDKFSHWEIDPQTGLEDDTMPSNHKNILSNKGADIQTDVMKVTIIFYKLVNFNGRHIY